MKIALIVDKVGSAIHRLSVAIQKYNPHLEIDILPFHPKRPSLDEITAVQEAIKECDILHVGYWKSGEKMKELVDLRNFNKPKILCHYNPYDVDKSEVNQWYDQVIVGNRTMLENYPAGRLINYGVDLDFFTYNNDYNIDGPVLMVVARIEGKKGVLEVAKACNKLKRKFVLVGRVSDGSYIEAVKQACPDMEFIENATEDQLKEMYQQAALHVCNSVDGFESGTLPILEAMASGVPVLTRNVGHVPDLYSEDGQNMRVHSHGNEDVDGIAKEIKELLENPELLKKIREKGWNTVKNWSDKKMAWKFGKLYYEAYRAGNNMPFVSVIVPTILKKPGAVMECLARIFVQDYPYFEIVLVNSGESEVDTKKVSIALSEKLKTPRIPIRYVRLKRKEGEYNLARARNYGVLYAQGELLVFCDDRIGMEQGAVRAFAEGWTTQQWQWGIKDENEKGFVENFSCCARNELIENGMFNESICSTYGCLTQEIRERLELRGWAPWLFRINREAKAKGLTRTSGMAGRRDDIAKSKLKLYMLYGE